MKSAHDWVLDEEMDELPQAEQYARVQDDALEECLNTVEAEMKKFPSERPTAREMDIISALANVRREILALRKRLVEEL